MLLDTYDAIPKNFGLTVLMGKLYPLNSVLNPLIFILFNMKMLRRVCSKKHDYLYIMTYTTTNGNCKMYRSSTSLTSFGKKTSRSGSTCSVSKVSVGSGVCSKIYIGSGVKRLSVWCWTEIFRQTKQILWWNHNWKNFIFIKRLRGMNTLAKQTSVSVKILSFQSIAGCS